MYMVKVSKSNCGANWTSVTPALNEAHISLNVFSEMDIL